MEENPVVHILGTVNPDDFGKHLTAVCAAQQVAAVRTAVTQWTLEGPLDAYELLWELLPWAREEGTLVYLSRTERPARAFLFDLDATLTTCEFLDALAEELGIGDRTHNLTRAAMDGKMDFGTSYHTRLQLFAGTPLDRIEAVVARLQLAEGAEALCETLRRNGIPTAIVTGGYARVGEAIRQRLGVDALYDTELEERDGILTGQIIGKLLDDAAKVRSLDDFCTKNGCQREDCAAIGDGANDLRMLTAAGHAILYSATPTKPHRSQPIDRILGLLNI